MSIPVLQAEAFAAKLVSNGDNVVTISDFEVANVADRVLVIGVEVNSVASGTPSVVSAAFGAAGFSYVTAVDSGDARCEVWKLVAPAVSTDDITVTITDPAGGITRATVVTALLFKTANQTEPFVINRGQTKIGNDASGDATLNINAMDEELIVTFLSVQKDHPATPVGGAQFEVHDVTQAGATGAETIRGRSSYKPGEGGATLVGYYDGGSGEREFSMICLPLCGPDVSLIARGTTEMSGTALMGREVPLTIDLVCEASVYANLWAKNWLQAFLSCEATLQASITRAKLLASQLQTNSIVGSRVGTGPRLFVRLDPATKQINKAFEVDLANHGTVETIVAWQENEHGVWVVATVKVNGVARDLTGSRVLLYLTDNPNSPFPMAVIDGPNAQAQYIAGRGDFAVGENEAQVDVAFANGDQYRSPSLTITIQQVVS